MATGAYHDWVRAGRPWELARPIRELRDAARAAGVRVLGTIGDQAHLESDNPQDHTPFTSTAWPVSLAGRYVVTAVDLDNVNDLGHRILSMARDGRLPWLKYMNFDRHNYSILDDFTIARANPDIHVHLSIRSDWVDRSIADLNPFTMGEDMLTDADLDKIKSAIWGPNPHPGAAGGYEGTRAMMLARIYRSVFDNDWTTALRRKIEVLDAKIDAIAKVIDHEMPGVADACAQAAANVTARDVADQLEITTKDQ